jgi:hypothetical protein
VLALPGEDWDAASLFYYFFRLLKNDSTAFVDNALGDATAMLKDPVGCVDDAVGVFGGDVSMDYRDFDTFKHHEVLFFLLKLRVPILTLKITPHPFFPILHSSIVTLWGVSLFLCILKRGISNFEHGFDLDASVWVFVDAGELLVASSLDWDDLLLK